MFHPQSMTNREEGTCDRYAPTAGSMRHDPQKPMLLTGTPRVRAMRLV